MQKHISAADTALVRVVIVTLDNHLASAVERARRLLASDMPGIEIDLHATATWSEDPAARERGLADIARANIVIASMLFMEDHIHSVREALEARRPYCDAMIAFMSAGDVIKLTKIGQLDMGKPEKGLMALLKRLKGTKKKQVSSSSSGARQMAMLRRIPRLLRFIPGTAQDLRAYFLTMQYWLAGSDDNVANMVRLLVDRYASGDRSALRGQLAVEPPADYPETGVYHPRLESRIGQDRAALPRVNPGGPTVGLLMMRSYVLAKNSSHYDAVITALEARGLNVVPAFAAGLDARPAIEKFFVSGGKPVIDALVSLTGFSLVGGPAYNDASAAETILKQIDVPYLAAHAVEFQTLEQWGGSERGLMPVEATMMVAIPELDGATGPMVFGGRSTAGMVTCTGCDRHCSFGGGIGERDMHSCPERAEMLAARVEKLIRLRKTERAERKLAITLFSFPPNAGATGTAAYLAVYDSLLNTLKSLKAAGYSVGDLPTNACALRERILGGNSKRYGTHANVYTRIKADDHVRRERWLRDIEKQWGPAPGRHQSDGSSIFVLGERFGNIFVGIQPSFGYEGDPMRLLFEKGFAPTHAFSAFYRYLREDFGANAVLHFGTHGALEFMPGKQTALSAACWPDRLIGDLPNIYLYAANNPSEGMIAKRRSAATLVSYLTPAIAQAGLYRGLLDLKSSIERWRGVPPEASEERVKLADLIQAQAVEVELAAAEPAWPEDATREILNLAAAVLELEQTLIPSGLHIAGEPISEEERVDLLITIAEATHGAHLERALIETLVRDGLATATVRIKDTKRREQLAALARANEMLSRDHEMSALLHALDGRFVPTAPSGDLIRTPDLLPTGRNLHGFDPFRMPSAFACKDGAEQAVRLLERHLADGNKLPESVAIVLWGTDNIKSEGGPIAQALALLGAAPRFDSYGRLCGADLIPLEELGRPRIDAVMTLSGIFRDLLPLQTKMLAEAAYLAARADEPESQNFVRKHALAYMAAHGCDLETAALRVFSNADGAYGSNVNQLIESASWQDEEELAETYTRRKSFAYGRNGKPAQQTALLQSILSGVEVAYQNLESVELGVTTVDHYFDTLGGISRAAQRRRGSRISVYIGDQTRGGGKVRTLSEQVALETRTRSLNPKWYEGMLKHGYEGVRHIEASITNTMGWSATTGQVAPWVYQQLTQTYVLDADMRARLAELNPTASAKVANRLLEAHARNYWSPDPETLEALRAAGDELEDRLEGIHEGVAA
jgi:magnesium chelatase subunit H